MKPMSLMAITAFVVSGAAVAQTQGYSSPQNPPTSQMHGQQAAPSQSTSTSGTAPSTAGGTTSGTTTSTPQNPPASQMQGQQAAPSQSSSTSGATPPAQATGTTSAATTTSTTSQAPAPAVVEQKVDLTSEPGPPADLRAARQEAINALAWAKSEGCRGDASPRECVRNAQDEYRATMARLGGAGGRTSASGTSAAGAARSDRN